MGFFPSHRLRPRDRLGDPPDDRRDSSSGGRAGKLASDVAFDFSERRMGWGHWVGFSGGWPLFFSLSLGEVVDTSNCQNRRGRQAGGGPTQTLLLSCFPCSFLRMATGTAQRRGIRERERKERSCNDDFLKNATFLPFYRLHF